LEGVTVETTGAGVGTGHQGKLGWKHHRLAGSGDTDKAVLQGLAEEFQYVPFKFCQFIEARLNNGKFTFLIASPASDSTPTLTRASTLVTD
jgi:hypothetical protein